jgi:hypothetical protein
MPNLGRLGLAGLAPCGFRYPCDIGLDAPSCELLDINESCNTFFCILFSLNTYTLYTYFILVTGA